MCYIQVNVTTLEEETCVNTVKINLLKNLFLIYVEVLPNDFISNLSDVVVPKDEFTNDFMHVKSDSVDELLNCTAIKFIKVCNETADEENMLKTFR